MNAAVRAGLFTVVCLAAWSQTTPDVGSGQIDLSTRWSFSAAFARGGFASLVSLPPVGDVRKFGAAGLVQEFQDAAKTNNVRLALVKPTSAPGIGDGTDVFQVRAPLYNYYTSVGPNTAGYPVRDSQNCPDSAPGTCVWGVFDKNYALFAFDKALLNGQNFSVADPFYTKWTAAGGIGGLGPALSAEQTVTSAVSSASATAQTFQSGAVYQIASGVQNGRVFTVGPAVYALYSKYAVHAGFLGFPSGDELAVAGGLRRQNFEGGAIEFTPGSPAELRLPVASIGWLMGGGTFRLNLGDTVSLQAATYDPAGSELTGRTISFVSSNTRVVALDAKGPAVTLRAVGAGTATVTAVSEGKSSFPVTVFVTAPCCAAGEGAPTAAIQAAFEQAISRTQISVRLPAAAPARRAGAGYLQDFQSTDASAARYVIAVGDAVGVAYLIAGDILDSWLALGGPAGPLGYPKGDAVNGRQLFEGGALAGSPVHQVTGLVLSKWAAQGYERGPAGMPAGDVASVLSSFATAGQTQQFEKGVMVAAGGKAYFVGATIAAAWQGAVAHRGALGLPTSDEFTNGGVRQQEFEGGTIDYSPGSTATRVSERPRKPAVSAAPGTVPAGSRVRLAFSGFTPGERVRVSVSGRPDFFINSDSGAHAWEVWVPADSASATVAVRATTDVGVIALSTYNVRSRAEIRIQLSKTAGDGQTGAPAAALPQAFRIRAADDAGNAIAGLPVVWTASPGAAIISADDVTNERGEAQARLRLPAGESVALATAETGRQVTTFSARASRYTLPNFPRLTDTAAAGTMVAATASILRYWQNRGEFAQLGTPIDAGLLRQLLQNACGLQNCDGFVSIAGSAATFVNLWRLGSVLRSGVMVTPLEPNLTAVRDALAQGTPVLLAAPSGNSSRFLAGIGIEADGRLSVYDPAPASSGAWDGRISAAVALGPGEAVSGLVVRSVEPVAVTAASGQCGRALEWPASTGVLRQQPCTGDAREYQIDLPGPGARAQISDIAAAGETPVDGAGALAWSAARFGSTLQISPQTIRFEAVSVVNGASFQPGVAPGSIATIFGAGLSRAGTGTRVDVGGAPTVVLAGLPFQINMVLPPDVAPGEQSVRVVSAFGTLERRVVLEESAPAIFMADARRGAVLNADNALNGPARPARRGSFISVYGTGFGPNEPVVALVNGRAVPVRYAGAAPGFIGLTQVNVELPESLAPDLTLPFVLRQGARETRAIDLAVE